MSNKKPVKDMTDHELLTMIAEKSARAEKIRIIAAIALIAIAVALIIALVVVVPELSSVLQNADKFMNSANGVVSSVKSITP